MEIPSRGAENGTKNIEAGQSVSFTINNDQFDMWSIVRQTHVKYMDEKKQRESSAMRKQEIRLKSSLIFEKNFSCGVL